MKVTLAPLAHDAAGAVSHLELAPEQAPFVGPINEMICETEPHIDFHKITAGPEIVGFFKIDRRYAQNHDFAHSDEFGLRGMLIGAQYQGRGYGKTAISAMRDYLGARYHVPSVVLTVNCNNPAARHVYLSGGWEDSGALYHGGRAGPQYILRLLL